MSVAAIERGADPAGDTAGDPAGSAAQQQGSDATGRLCGFSRCRAPLPAPGSRGGRPYAYCRDTTWAGGLTCQQLAVAETRLRTALGDSPEASALTAATGEFTDAAHAVLGPLETLSSSLNTVRGRLDTELAAATTRAEAAEAQAHTDRGRAEAAEARAAAADEAARTAETAAADHDQGRAAAEAARDEANERARAAELAAARAHARATEQAERTDAAEQRARAETNRAQHLASELADARGQVATLTAERTHAHQALTETQQALAETRRATAALEARSTTALEAAQADARADRDRLAAAEDRARVQTETHRQERDELRAGVVSAEHTATTHAQLLERVRTLTVGRDSDHDVRRQLTVLLDSPDGPTDTPTATGPACPTCGHTPARPEEANAHRADLATVWLHLEGDTLREARHCARCQPHHEQIATLSCTRCGDGPLVTGMAHDPDPAHLPDPLSTWLHQHGWGTAPELTCADHPE